LGGSLTNGVIIHIYVAHPLLNRLAHQLRERME
jgi:hypothetical protein